MAINNIKYQTIFVYDMNGNYLNQYETIYSAALGSKSKYKNIENLIRTCLLGKIQSADRKRYSYIPFLKNPLPKDYCIHPTMRKSYSINRYDIKGKFIEEITYSTRDKELYRGISNMIGKKRYRYKDHYYLKEKYNQIPDDIFNKIQNKRKYNPVYKYNLDGKFIDIVTINLKGNKDIEFKRGLYGRAKNDGFYYLKEKYDQIPEDILNKIKYKTNKPLYKYDLNGNFIEIHPYKLKDRIRSTALTTIKHKSFYYLKDKYDQIPEDILNKIKYKRISRWT